MNDLELFWISGSPPSWRVMLALALKEIDYTSTVLSTSNKEHKSESFLTLNPKGTVPVLRHGDFVLRESLAILVYLDELQPEPKLFGNTITDTGRIWQWVLEFDENTKPILSTVAKIAFRNQSEKKADELHAAVEQSMTVLGDLEGMMADPNSVFTDRVSAVDVVLYPVMQRLSRALTSLGQYEDCRALSALLGASSVISSWEEKVQGIANYEGTFPPHWR